MKKHTVAVVVGTRPEGVKLCPVVQEFRRTPGIRTLLYNTGQHSEMLDQVLEAFGIVADCSLNLMEPGQPLSGLSARVLSTLGEVLARDRPDLVVVQGDTSTTLCGALAAYYNRIPVAHVEAGLRTHDLYAPWPEEGNRVLVSGLTTLHFAPTEKSRENLLLAGVAPEQVLVTGNTVVDAVLLAISVVKSRGVRSFESLPQSIMAGPSRVVLVTLHRRESFGRPLQQALKAVAELALQHPAVEFVLPVHRNPSVRCAVDNVFMNASERAANIHLLQPLGYLPFVALMDRCFLILTDSGGVQEEAPSLNKPVLVLRDKTERPEAIDSGCALLVGTDAGVIVRETNKLLESEYDYSRMAGAENPFGDGLSSKRIVDACRRFLVGRTREPQVHD